MKAAKLFLVIFFSFTICASMIHASSPQTMSMEVKLMSNSRTEAIQSDIQKAELKTAPLNPEYVKYLKNKDRDAAFTIDSDGSIHHLGYIPPRITYHTSLPPSYVPMVLPSSYDLRDVNYVTPVKNQGSCGSCWAFSTYGSIESFWLKTISETHDLSENNLIYGSGFVFDPCDGGNYKMSAAYLSRGDGPISESDDPYEAETGSYHSGLTPVAYVFEARFLPDNDNYIKQMIYENGAIATSMHVADANSGESYDEYMNPDNTYYYDGTEPINHGVTLVGWDDNKVVDGAPGNGAWIIKNSWGSSWGESGYFYVSYYDTKINSGPAMWPYHKAYRSSQKILFYDALGSISNGGYGDESDYALVKYPISENMDIEEVGTFMDYTGSVAFEFYTQFDGSILSGYIDSIGVKACPFAGYYTYTLPEKITLTDGDELYVKVLYNTPGYSYAIPIEIVDSTEAIPDIESDIFWISTNGTDASWFALGSGTGYEWDPCVKLYGNATDLSVDFSASPTSGNVPLTVDFTDLSSGSINSWLWDFGDGDTSHVQNPQHIYDDLGSFTVELTVSDGSGSATKTKTDYISVSETSDTLLVESFESGVVGWTVIDNDADTKAWTLYSESGSSFDLAYTGDIGAGIEFNSAGNDDWLITPPLSIPADSTYRFSFWAKSRSASFPEDFNIKLSTSGKTVADFINELLSVTGVSDSWTQYSADFSANEGQTIYLAVQCVSVDDWYLFADDFLCHPYEIPEIPYSGGDGSESDPYRIANLGDLAELSATPDDWDAYFIQTDDINAVGTESWNDGSGFKPIGNDTISFKGNYDGQDHLISGLFIDRPLQDFIGLFGYIAGATIENLTMSGVNVTGAHRTGGMIGEADSSSTITDCHVSGAVTGERYVGGLNGHNLHSKMLYCSASVEVYGNTSFSDFQYVGGLTGANSNIGYSSDSAIVRECFSEGSVTGARIVGGLAGNNASNNSLIENCYSTAKVEGTVSMTGGCVGNNTDNAHIEKCYNTGEVTGSSYTGGFLGRTQTGGTNAKCFWDTETSGQGSSAGGTGKTTAEMLTETTYSSAAWDLSNIWDIDAAKNGGYPYLSWQVITESQSFAFTPAGHIDDGGSAWDLTVSADSTIFLANDSDGLRAYTYDGSSFVNTAHIDPGSYVRGIAVGPDGTVFIGNYANGLKAYTYNGSSFTLTASIDDGGDALGIAIADDGTVFLANNDDGIRAYTYNGSSFTNTAHIDDGDMALDLALGADGAIFVANRRNGLRAYTYDGSSFTAAGDIISNPDESAYDVSVGPDGTIFLANYGDGLRAYSHDGSSFTNTAHIYQASNAKGVTVNDDGVIFLANDTDGLRAYTYDGYAFTNTAHIDDGDNAEGVAVGPDGTVFLANDDAGIRAYRYGVYETPPELVLLSGDLSHNYGEIAQGNDPDTVTYQFTLANTGDSLLTGEVTEDADWLSVSPSNFSLTKGSNQTITVTAATSELSADTYSASINVISNGGDLSGSADVTIITSVGFELIAEVDDGGSIYGLDVHDGTIFLANDYDGLRSYEFDGSSLDSITQIKYNGENDEQDVAYGNDGIVYCANGTYGLNAFNYNGTSFSYVTGIDNGGTAEGIKLAADGTIFLANGTDGLRAYSFDGSSFTNTADIDDGGEALDLAIAADGTIFMANDEDGLRAYTYNGSSFTNTAHIDDGGTAMSVDVGPDGTVFLANNDDGVRAYSYNGSSFSLIDHISVLDEAADVDVSPEGVVFVADYLEGMGAYSWEGNTLTHLAQIDDGGPYNALMAEADGLIYMTCKYDGLRIYRFSGYDAVDDHSLLPAKFALEQNYPNPFNPTTSINYALPSPADVNVTIYDLMGRKVETLIDAYHQPGNFQVIWNAGSLASGVYIICFRADDFVDTKKMVLMK
jgi:C1A family cysteine protease/PKD repeat protein